MLSPTGILASLSITTLISTEEWVFKSPVRGDHIRVDRGLYNHHGVYISDDEIIHFSATDDDDILGNSAQILQTDISGFMRGGKLEVKVYTDEEIDDLFPVEDIVNWARACIGDDGYNLCFNNCEHFANYCTLGRYHSRQVLKVLTGDVMGLKSWLGDVVGAVVGAVSSGGSSSRSSSTTTYEPDKVRVAEIEADCQLKLAGKEQERMKLYVETQTELLEFNARMEAAVIEARVRGEQELQKTMIEIMREVNIIAEQRLKLIETAHLDIIKQVEGYYKELENEIKLDSDVSIKEKLPALLTILQQFEEGSPEHEIYKNNIDRHCSLHFKFIEERIKQLQIRQNKIVESCITGKEQINSSISLLVDKRMEQLGVALQARQQVTLSLGQEIPQIGQRLQIADDASA